MSENLIEILARLDKELKEVKSELSTIKKSKGQDAPVDIKKQIIETVDQDFVNDLYRIKR